MSCTWEAERGFGERSWRYSAVINDMKIEKLFVEIDSHSDDLLTMELTEKTETEER